MLGYFRFSWQRRLRRIRSLARRLKQATHNYLGRYLIGKKRQLIIIRRFVVVWTALPVLTTIGLAVQIGGLESYYLSTGPLPGGHYIEGSVGEVKLINPILPENSLSADINRLIFGGLLRRNPAMKLEGDLASDWSISADNRSYTFKLRRDVKWHDGVPFTARDVIFTLTAIQNPDSRSPLAPSWTGVKAEAKDDYTVVFTLPSPYSAFLESTVVGILPSHLLESSDPSALRSASFNQHPVGTGPFRFQSFGESHQQVELEAYAGYHRGRPKLDRLTFRFYATYEKLLDAYAKRQVVAISRWHPGSTPESELANLRLHYFYLPDQVNLFFRTTSPFLSDRQLRRALTLATDRAEVVDKVGGAAVRLGSPLLPGQIGYNSSRRQPGYDLSAAEKALDEAGWVKRQDGTRVKNGQPLRLSLATIGGDYGRAAEIVRQQWQRAGVILDVVTADDHNLQQSYIRPRRYDLLLYGITIGSDPDVYVYWHSSQANDPGLNLSQYNSSTVDKALESGRITADPQIRQGKYQSFAQAWLEDFPAVVLYQPTYIYATNDQVLGISAERLGDPTDRFYGVEQWTLHTQPVAKGRH